MSKSTTHNKSYYLEYAVFKVEKQLFKVPQYALIACSEYFKKLLLDENGDPKFSSDTAPIVLEDVSASDFESFLRLLYPLKQADPNDISISDWWRILKLAVKWSLTDIRQVGIEKTSTEVISNASAMMKISKARKHRVPEWLLAGYEELVKRDAGITEDEAKELGMSTTVRLYQERERCRAAGHRAMGQEISLKSNSVPKGGPKVRAEELFKFGASTTSVPPPAITPKPALPSGSTGTTQGSTSASTSTPASTKAPNGTKPATVLPLGSEKSMLRTESSANAQGSTSTSASKTERPVSFQFGISLSQPIPSTIPSQSNSTPSSTASPSNPLCFHTNSLKQLFRSELEEMGYPFDGEKSTQAEPGFKFQFSSTSQ